MKLIVQLAGEACVAVPGWSVVAVAALLAAPRLVREYLRTPEG